MVTNAIPEKPWKVRTAVIMFCVSLGIALVGIITRSMTVFSTVATAETIISGLIVLAVYLGLIIMIGKGKNWARIAFLVLSIFDVPPAIWAIIKSLSHPAFSGPAGLVIIILKVAELTLRIVALWLCSARLFGLVQSDEESASCNSYYQRLRDCDLRQYRRLES